MDPFSLLCSFYFTATALESVQKSRAVQDGHLVYCIDYELVYEPFFADFGPLNMGLSYRFCERTQVSPDAVL